MSEPAIVTLRLARLPDARAMAEMSRDLVEAGLGWRYTPTRIAALIADAETVALVACTGARIRGLAVMAFGDDDAHLSLLCVQPAQQRSGIGRQLTDWLVRSAEVAGIASIRLELRADNLAALAFYRRLAFVERERIAGYYSGRIDARRMVRMLRLGAAMP